MKKPCWRTIHGLYYNKLYTVYKSIIHRCENPKSTHFNLYGGRGISICQEWKYDFFEFEKWALQNGYIEGLSIERKDNDLGYSPDNCTWIPRSNQSKNTRVNRKLEFNGEIHNVADWARKLGVPKTTLHGRLNLGWSVEDTLTLKVCSEKGRNTWQYMNSEQRAAHSRNWNRKRPKKTQFVNTAGKNF